MLSEKDMENAIAADPEKYINESGLKVISRQHRIDSYIFDLLLEDRHGGKLLVEIQRGTLDRTHTYKILDYYDAYKEQNPAEFIELMVIANRIPVERKKRLQSMGISFREISESEFLADKSEQLPTEQTTEIETPLKETQFTSELGYSLSEDLKYRELIKNLVPIIKANSAWTSQIKAKENKIFFKQFVEKQYELGKNWMITNLFKFESGSVVLDFFIYSDKYFHSVKLVGSGIALSVYISKKSVLKKSYEELCSDLENAGFSRYAKNRPKVYDKWFMKPFVDEAGKSLHEVNPENVKRIFLEENKNIAPVLIKHFA